MIRLIIISFLLIFYSQPGYCVRPDEMLADPKLDGTDEIALWRAVRQAIQDQGSPSAAAVFAAGLLTWTAGGCWCRTCAAARRRMTYPSR